MKSIKKYEDSSVHSMKYPKDRDKIINELRKEQGNLCAYTEDWLSGTHCEDVEHFDDSLKHTENDGYQNWFATCHKVNIHKGRKFAKYAPMTHPTDSIIDDVLQYQHDKGGLYTVDENSENFEEVNTLINDWLRLNARNFREERYFYIKELLELNLTKEDIIAHLSKPGKTRFRKAVETVFDVEVPLPKWPLDFPFD